MEGVHLPPPLVPAVAFALAAATHLSLPLPELPAGAWSAGALLVVLGVGLVGWAIMTQTRAGTNPDVRAPTTALCTTGPYAWSRNPIYTGFLLAQAGAGLWTGWWLATVLVPASGWALSVWVVRREEAWLSQRFPDYEAYRARVRRWL